jgi:hypothetical protein
MVIDSGFNPTALLSALAAAASSGSLPEFSAELLPDFLLPGPAAIPSDALAAMSKSIAAAASATATAAFTASTSYPTSSSSPTYDDAIDEMSKPRPPPQGECQLLGPFALWIQLLLGLLALSALVFKRWRERPQRPLKIWTFDVSKQVVGSVLVHMANLVMSMLSSGQFDITIAGSAKGEEDNEANPCSFYFLNLAIDTTLGIPILILLLHGLTKLFLRTSLGDPPESLESGRYSMNQSFGAPTHRSAAAPALNRSTSTYLPSAGAHTLPVPEPPRYAWWAKQSLIYFLGLFLMKLIVLLIFIACPWIVQVGDWALKWTEGDEVLQVGFVMLFFPVVMNACQYVLIDSFIKGRSEGWFSGSGSSSESNSEDEAGGGRRDGYGDGGEDEGLLQSAEREVDVVKHKARKTKVAHAVEGYKSDEDGEEISTSEGSSNRRTEAAVQRKLLTEDESGEE